MAGDPRSLLGNKALVQITADDIEGFLQKLRSQGRSASTYNHYRQYLRALLAWATRKGYLAVNPLQNAEIPRLTLSKRSRRLQPGEERKLLAAAPARLYRLIVAALETGCRLGELLSLQWQDVHFGRRELRVRAENAKDAEDRVVPITTRLAAVLEMAQHDPDGNRLPPEAHVFGDAIGGRVRNVTRLWQTCVLKAHDVRPTREKRPHEGGTDRRGHRRQGGRLTRECRDAVARIDLHFHDLRREAGSRWMEGGMALHVIQQLLGHADARTTSIYLNATRLGLHESMQRFEQRRGEVCPDVAQEPRNAGDEWSPTDDANLLNLQDLRRGAGDGDRTRDQQLGKL